MKQGKPSQQISTSLEPTHVPFTQHSMDPNKAKNSSNHRDFESQANEKSQCGSTDQTEESIEHVMPSLNNSRKETRVVNLRRDALTVDQSKIL